MASQEFFLGGGFLRKDLSPRKLRCLARLAAGYLVQVNHAMKIAGCYGWLNED